MKRVCNDEFLTVCARDMKAVYAVQIFRDDYITKARIVGVLDSECDDYAFVKYLSDAFDAEEAIVFDIPESYFQERIEESESLDMCSLKSDSFNDVYKFASNVAAQLSVDLDGYDSLYCKNKELAEFIDMLRDGTYLFCLE